MFVHDTHFLSLLHIEPIPSPSAVAMASTRSAPTAEYIRFLFDSISQSNWEPFIAALDPNMQWTTAAGSNSEASTGVYNIEELRQNVVKPILTRVKDQRVKMNVLNIDIIGQKAIMECAGEATQLNGQPYNNRYALFLIFSEETGKIVEAREYLDTALVRELIQSNN